MQVICTPSLDPPLSPRLRHEESLHVILSLTRSTPEALTRLHISEGGGTRARVMVYATSPEPPGFIKVAERKQTRCGLHTLSRRDMTRKGQVIVINYFKIRFMLIENERAIGCKSSLSTFHPIPDIVFQTPAQCAQFSRSEVATYSKQPMSIMAPVCSQSFISYVLDDRLKTRWFLEGPTFRHARSGSDIRVETWST